MLFISETLFKDASNDSVFSNLMAPDEMKNLGFEDDGGSSKAQLDKAFTDNSKGSGSKT